MMPDSVELIDADTGQPVFAVLLPEITTAQMIAAEARWAPLRSPTAEHSHWDWSVKTGALARPGVRCMGIMHDGEMQGMAMLVETGKAARLGADQGRPLVYIDFLEAAPWNLGPVSPPVRGFRAVGVRLVAAAVARSRALGYAGRVGLHSLEQAEGFYQYGCGMQTTGPDVRYHTLSYWELTAATAGTRFPEEAS